LPVQLRDLGLVNVQTDPLLDPLRNEPRFQAIEQALKVPELTDADSRKRLPSASGKTI
jgi:hypothetical protein